jgi:hypothetical protein
MKFRINNFSSANSNERISLKCPHCGHKGTFENVGRDIDINDSNNRIGIRKCPNESCFGYLFFICKFNEILITYPSEAITFDRNGIPENILKAFEEAVKCHSNSCFIASAIMIRKTLEEICKDRDSSGNNLYSKLKNLGEKIVIPKELVDGMQELRLLGNDAAHIESETFNEIGKIEIEISIEFTKEILKAVYQYESLLDKIRSLKK